ncbi:hypothetical protein [Mucilaginibacter lacusdianchii]|uniref:hypothetical protein n=1 Tax=Mucilaginibacter lacusdianchii TaxID=2684211 RepID=UPI00131D077D|nr:hypothetical protein [Mucilaginibacter sp. JXJ CY 39]
MSHIISVQQAMAAPKLSLVGKTVNLVNWEISEVRFFVSVMNWLDDNFYYMLKAEAESLTFFIFHAK